MGLLQPREPGDPAHKARGVYAVPEPLGVLTGRDAAGDELSHLVTVVGEGNAAPLSVVAEDPDASAAVP